MTEWVGMGFWAKVKPERIEELRGIISDKAQPQYIENFLKGAIIKEDGEIDFAEYNSTWYLEDTQDFALFIKDFVTGGGMEFDMPSENETWGFDFDGKGGVIPYTYDAVKKVDTRTLEEWASCQTQ
jgi:hypothetical protein